jgi:hypothetical protein
MLMGDILHPNGTNAMLCVRLWSPSAITAKLQKIIRITIVEWYCFSPTCAKPMLPAVPHSTFIYFKSSFYSSLSAEKKCDYF